MTYAHQAITATRPSVPTPLPTPLRDGVEQAIARASAKTGVDFSYLMDKAAVESSLNPGARAKNSSATGLYQFVEETWLEMVRDYGHKYGLSGYADCIDRNCHVKNARMRRAILDLRQDPETSAYMAAEYATRNADTLKSRMGNQADIGKTELYLAHFLGAGGAAKFIQTMDRLPDARAARFFPAEARTNPGVFYDSATGRARSLQQIYDHFAAKFDNSSPEVDMNIPSNKPSPPRPARGFTPGGPYPDSYVQVVEVSNIANENMPDPWVEGTPIAGLTPEFVDRLLATPPRLFGSEKPTDSTARSDRADALEQVETATRQVVSHSVHQAALLILAQNYAHEDPDRYNA